MNREKQKTIPGQIEGMHELDDKRKKRVVW